jgi:hypothetical protein
MADGDPATAVRALIEAENALDVDAAMALFEEDAVVTLPTGVLSTPEQIRGWQAGLAAGHFHADIGPIGTEGEHARFSGTVGFDPFRGMGIDAMGSEWAVTVVGGRITAFTYTFTPDGAARLQAAMGGGVPAERSE